MSSINGVSITQLLKKIYVGKRVLLKEDNSKYSHIDTGNVVDIKFEDGRSIFEPCYFLFIFDNGRACEIKIEHFDDCQIEIIET